MPHRPKSIIFPRRRLIHTALEWNPGEAHPLARASACVYESCHEAAMLQPWCNVGTACHTWRGRTMDSMAWMPPGLNFWHRQSAGGNKRLWEMGRGSWSGRASWLFGFRWWDVPRVNLVTRWYLMIPDAHNRNAVNWCYIIACNCSSLTQQPGQAGANVRPSEPWSTGVSSIDGVKRYETCMFKWMKVASGKI